MKHFLVALLSGLLAAQPAYASRAGSPLILVALLWMFFLWPASLLFSLVVSWRVFQAMRTNSPEALPQIPGAKAQLGWFCFFLAVDGMFIFIMMSDALSQGRYKLLLAPALLVGLHMGIFLWGGVLKPTRLARKVPKCQELAQSWLSLLLAYLAWPVWYFVSMSQFTS